MAYYCKIQIQVEEVKSALKRMDEEVKALVLIVFLLQFENA